MWKRKARYGLLVVAGVASVVVLLLVLRAEDRPVEEVRGVVAAAADAPGQAAGAAAAPAGEAAYWKQIQVVADLAEEVSEELLREGASLADNPVHPGRLALQRQMRRETAEQTFLHLTDNDNFKMLAPLMASRPLSPGCYASDVRIMCKMTRIRKLLAGAREDPQGVSAFLQEQLSAVAKTFPAAYEDFMRMLKADRGGGRLVVKELPEAQKQRLLSTTAVYVLSEIGAYDSLPLLARLSTSGKPADSANFAGSCQVNPTFLLYAMHGLTGDLPEGRLSAVARSARAEYLAAAEKAGIPHPDRTTVAAWDAPYHEDDFRTMLPGRQLRLPRGQPTVELTVFPAMPGLSPSNVRQLLGKMRAFVQEAFAASGGYQR